MEGEGQAVEDAVGARGAGRGEEEAAWVGRLVLYLWVWVVGTGMFLVLCCVVLYYVVSCCVVLCVGIGGRWR